MSDTVVDSGPYVQPEQLCIGLYVHLDLSWTQHPFTFSSFKIKSKEQIETIQSLGLNRIRYNPDKSDCSPPAREPTPPTASPTQTLPPAGESDAVVAAKRDRMARLDRQRAKAQACEKELVSAAQTVRSINQNVFSRPDEVRESAITLIEGMAASMLVEADVSIQLMADKVGGEEVYHHALNVSLLSMMLAKELKAPAETVRSVGLAALFHDIGELEIPDRIRKQITPLNKAELALWQQHCEYGTQIGKKLSLPADVLHVIGQHHERVDGTGFPAHLKAPQMSLMTRIVSLVNAYEELCNPRDPSRAHTPHEALSTMFAQQRSQFDPLAMSTFVRCMGVYPPGTIVVLSNGTTGMVVSVNTTKPLRPMVLVFDPAVPREEAILVDLEQEADVSVTKTLKPPQLSPEAHTYLAPRKRVTYYFDSES
ncbi:MAG TPA: HD domain-containing phosphohydrolase [Aquabacterium sp.]|nr:HD domain-containing phosphohydrolase [Aquabacterium sp.]